MEIIPNIWIGNYKDALNKEFLIKNNIKYIINCTNTILFTDIKDIIKIRIPVNDSLKEIDIDLLSKYIPKTNDILKKCFYNLDPILVHCYAGKQRSATIIASFLMKNTNLDKLKIIALIQSKKSDCFKPSINFNKCLDKLQLDLLKNNYI